MADEELEAEMEAQSFGGVLFAFFPVLFLFVDQRERQYLHDSLNKEPKMFSCSKIIFTNQHNNCDF